MFSIEVVPGDSTASEHWLVEAVNCLIGVFFFCTAALKIGMTLDAWIAFIVPRRGAPAVTIVWDASCGACDGRRVCHKLEIGIQ